MTSSASTDSPAEAPAPGDGRAVGVSILGSTGSIGTQTLEVIDNFRDRFRVRALTAYANAELLIAQAQRYRPDCVVIGEKERYGTVRDALADTGIDVLSGKEGFRRAAVMDGVDTVVAAIVGVAGLEPVLAAVDAGRRVALANKETLVVAGGLVRSRLQKRDATIIPVDSEHSAIFQCLLGEDAASVEELVLTASGGPFRTRAPGTFDSITPEEALDHPNWSMGAKISIDSATMMNKGLEVIEARWLFDLPPEKLRVLVHPESVVHSLVTFVDGTSKAQLGVPDMKGPIQYALTYPERRPAPHERLDWHTLGALHFEAPDEDRFPCLRLAYEALEQGGAAPAVLNASNEQAVALFLEGGIPFVDIPRVIEKALSQLSSLPSESLEDIRTIDAEARRFVRENSLSPQ